MSMKAYLKGIGNCFISSHINIQYMHIYSDTLTHTPTYTHKKSQQYLIYAAHTLYFSFGNLFHLVMKLIIFFFFKNNPTCTNYIISKKVKWSDFLWDSKCFLSWVFVVACVCVCLCDGKSTLMQCSATGHLNTQAKSKVKQ